MSSPPNNFVYGSISSVYSIHEAFASYNRAQYYASLNVQTSEVDDSSDDEPYLSETSDTLEPADDDFAEGSSSRTMGIPEQDTIPIRVRDILQTAGMRTRPDGAHVARETTPLLRRAASIASQTKVVIDHGLSNGKPLAYPDALDTVPEISTPLSSDTIAEHHQDGKSTYVQTLLNCIGLLLGLGMLSEPLAFAYAGWLWGTALIIFFGIITCYTAKLLAHEILHDSRLRSYADIGRKAFGPKSSIPTNVLFCLDLFALSVILITLAADSLEAVWPAYSTNTYKVLFLLVLVPTVFMPLSILSYTSLIGIISMFLVIVVIFIDGFSKSDSPGSFWSPAPTSLTPGSLGGLGMTLGLLMAGFAGHVVMPSLARDMEDPSQFDHLVDQAFFISTFIYAIVGYAGYLMFGNSVSDEISKDLWATPGYSATLNQVVMWSLVITPLSKFALSTRPLNIILESTLGLEVSPRPSVEDATGSTHKKRGNLKNRLLVTLERILVPVASIAVSILVPQFCAMMAFLGSFCAFVMCVIGPISAKIAMTGECRWYDAALLGISSLMAVWGTISAFWMA